MNEKLDKILYKLRDKYPQYSINFVSKKNNNNTLNLTVNEQKVYEFNPDIVLKDVEFLENNKNYYNFILQLFIDPIEEYHKNYNPGKSKRRNSGLSLQEIQEAINNTNSNAEAARFCHVSYNTYKKYAKMFGKWEENLGTRKKGVKYKRYFIRVSGRRYTEQDMIDGNIPVTYSSFKLKEKLFALGLIKEECEICGFHEKRITDNKVPLMLDYRDGYKDNRKLENIRVLCFNCYYLYVGTPWYRKKGKQQSDIKIENEFKLMQSREKKQNNYVEL